MPELVSRSGLAGTPLLFSTGSTAASQVGDQLHKLPPIKRSPTGGTSLVSPLEADTTNTASEESTGVSRSGRRGEQEVGNCEIS